MRCHAMRSTHELLAWVGVARQDVLDAPDFPTLVPRGFAARMTPGRADDPLLLQVLARATEPSKSLVSC